MVRAVHLDIVPNLTTSAFLRSFKQFTARQELPQELISDNGKTFVAAAELIRTATIDKEVDTSLEWELNSNST